MPLEPPVLDDRSFEEIKSQLIARIPRYAPDWTDFNESDPGITLIELFAWLAEMQLYRMNKLPDLHYIKFLQLLNMELRPPVPARAHLTFTPSAGAEMETVPARTQIAAQSAETGDLIVFETDEAVDVIPYLLTDVMVYDGAAFTNVTDANDSQSESFRPLGWTPQMSSALYLGFEPPEPTVQIGKFPSKFRLRLYLVASSLAGKPQRCEPKQAQVGQAPAPPVKLVWEYRYPDAPYRWQRLTVFEDGTSAFTHEGDIVLEGPSKIRTSTEGLLNDDEDARFWIRCRMDEGPYPAGQEPEVDFIRANTVSALSLTTMDNEILGTSEGLPDQSFELRHKPAYLNPTTETFFLRIEVAETPEKWERRADFLSSGPEDAHFVLNPTTGEVRFGDGCHGRIPLAGAEIIVTQYRYGGGKAANVSADTINIPLTSLTGVESVSNIRAAVGGEDEQDLDELKREVPLRIRHQNRAVTTQDFATLAKQAGGVYKATALSLVHRDFPGVKVPGAVTVVIVPDNDEIRPEPSSELIRHVCSQLDKVRLLTTELTIKGPVYQSIKVITRVRVKSNASFDYVKNEVSDALNKFLDPRGWEFGHELYPTSLYEVILNVKDVVSVPDLSLMVEGVPHFDYAAVPNTPQRDPIKVPVRVPADGLVYGLDHEITVVPEELS